jgi:hypothetical protein
MKAIFIIIFGCLLGAGCQTTTTATPDEFTYVIKAHETGFIIKNTSDTPIKITNAECCVYHWTREMVDGKVAIEVAPACYGLETRGTNGIPLSLAFEQEHYFQIPDDREAKANIKRVIRTTYECNNQKRTNLLVIQGDQYLDDKK